MKIRRPRGTNDILPPQINNWHFIEEKIRAICRNFGYQEIRTPMFEHTELFSRGIGETTDIVEKEMYTFVDRGKRSITLRPEGTASVVRAFAENNLAAGSLPAKLYYLGPMFRYEKPQAGRYRQFYQFGIEAIGSQDPALDVEAIILPIEFYKACGLSNFSVHINSLGCPQCRPGYRQALLEYFQDHRDELCSNCQSRLERNPLRVLDCKNRACRKVAGDIPPISDFLCSECTAHFDQVQHYLGHLDVVYTIDSHLVRGFDYYTKTIFEIMAPGLGAQNAIGGGGRYDGLVEEIGGQAMPAVGFAAGLDRLVLSLEKQKSDLFPQVQPDVFIVHFKGETKQEAVYLLNELRKKGIWAETDYLDRSLRSQMKTADRLQSKWVIILGEEELATGMVKLRRMDTGLESEILAQTVGEYLVNQINGGQL